MKHKTFISSLFAGLLLAGLAIPAVLASGTDATTIFLVRHAEKTDDSEDPELSEAGQRRAQTLAFVLKDAGVERIFSTDYLRTRNTAAPLAAMLDVPLQTYDPKALKAFASSISRSGQRILVVGHSNTTPELVSLLGGEPGNEIDEESEYNRLYILTIGADDSVTSLMLRYGTDSGH